MEEKIKIKEPDYKVALCNGKQIAKMEAKERPTMQSVFEKHLNSKPKTFGNMEERVYPSSAVISMLHEYTLYIDHVEQELSTTHKEVERLKEELWGAKAENELLCKIREDNLEIILFEKEVESLKKELKELTLEEKFKNLKELMTTSVLPQIKKLEELLIK
jgi:hypothetical protein